MKQNEKSKSVNAEGHVNEKWPSAFSLSHSTMVKNFYCLSNQKFLFLLAHIP